MNEPVGNTPRGSAIPNNSHKAREDLVPNAGLREDREELTSIVTGKVTARKPPWWKRVARSMIADDATSVGDFILTDVMVPAVKNLLYDVVTGGASRTLYGSGRGARRDSGIRGGGPVSSIRTRYDRMSEERPAPRTLSQEQRARHEFQDITLDVRDEAVGVLEAMLTTAGRYGTVSVADLYTLTDITAGYVDRQWGWTESALATADIRQHRGGWRLDLPDPQSLR